ncbi:MAG: excinuclease ABC subunit UvrC [Candidatus Aminicenantales bacterium]
MTAKGSKSLVAKVAAFPEKPGIYFFRNRTGGVLYIGKARSLRSRVRSYLLPNPDFKVGNILRETADIDYILTGSEKEAAFLENNYIQQYQPKFNLRLKDDKSFPYLKLTVRDRYPGIFFSRKVEKDGARYFGPFSPAGRARKTIHLVNRNFGIRGCEQAVFRGRKRPCLEHDLGLCSAPCVGLIAEADYRKDTENARLFLEGRTEELTKGLKARMKAAAEARMFEEAARWRDLLRTLEDIKQKPGAISTALEDLDAAGFARSGDTSALHVFFMRRGKIRDSRELVRVDRPEKPREEILAELLLDFYRTAEKPPRILLPFEMSVPDFGPKTKGIVPKTGRYRKLVELADRNADLAIRKRERELSPLIHLGRILGLAAAPRRIEGFDISNTGGEESVGSLVVFDDGVPNRDEYRKFKIRTVTGSNDVASLEEVVGRRFARLKEESRPLPDLVLVDGGKGQLAAGRKALAAAGAAHTPIISLAKREEIVYTPADPDGIRLDRTAPALKILQHVRDEAHRFAVSFHRKRRAKKSFASDLDGIPGIGPKRKAALLERFGGMDAIREASLEELTSVLGAKAALLIWGRTKSTY